MDQPPHYSAQLPLDQTPPDGNAQFAQQGVGYPVAQQPPLNMIPQLQQQPIQYYGVQQQQPLPSGNTVVVVQQHNAPTQSFTGHIVFACIVFWCCGWICGLVAFILAMVAMDRASSGDKDSAKGLGHASMAFSVVGLLIGLAVIIYLIVALVIAADSTTTTRTCSYSTYYGYNRCTDGSRCSYISDCY